MSDNFFKYLINNHQKNQLLLEQEKTNIYKKTSEKSSPF